MKSLKNLTILSLLLTAFSLSSCFNIIEEITLRKDGSGSYRFTLDGNQIKAMAEGFGKGMLGKTAEKDSVEQKAPADTAAVIDKFAGLKRMKGISNVQQIDDKNTMSMGVSFDFASLNALQQVMDSLGNVKMFGSLGVGRDIKLDGKTVHRENKTTIRDMLAAAMQQKSGDKGAPDMTGSEGFMRIIFGSMSFKQVYNFPDRKIKKCNVKDAEISKDRHTLTLLEKPFDDNAKNKKSPPDELLIRLK